MRSLMKIAVPALAVSVALAGCGSRDSGGGNSGTSGGGKVAKIGVIAPLSGDLSALGIGIKNSVDLAIQQANKNNTIPGWKLELDAQDDQAKPEVGKNAATTLASDDEVVGVVGNLNSSVSQSTQPVFAAANVTQVSPANTNPTLTDQNGKRPYATYFRTCTTDAVQGPFAADYLIGKGIKKVATIHDKKTYGQGLVEAFTTEFKKKGGEIVDAETIDPTATDYSAVITKVKPSNPEAIYYGGEYPQAGPLSKQVKAAGMSIPVMGGDGIFDPKYIQLAGSAATGDLATSVGAPTDSTQAGKDFLAAYKAAGFKDEAGAYGGYSYDAANAIINALKVSLKNASSPKDARQATVKAMADVKFEGVTGTVGFDQFGDATSKVLTVYKVVNGAWATEKTGSFTG